MSHALVLNRNFYAVHIADWRKALSMVYQGHAEVVDEDLVTYDFASWAELSAVMSEHPAGFVHSPSLRIAVPEIIRLTRYDRMPQREVVFTRRNLYEHYRHRCCYCGGRFRTSELNLDHVVPRSRGGDSSWDNVVTACIPCNTKKGNRLPKEAGMNLLVSPTKPNWGGMRSLVLSSPIPIRASWQKLIDRAYWDAEIGEN
ncbi:MAG: HNH endonuclease [Elusimicrobia bacterium]|nr:HNH endonuclease [Elusimicrobiota bacterium]